VGIYSMETYGLHTMIIQSELRGFLWTNHGLNRWSFFSGIAIFRPHGFSWNMYGVNHGNFMWARTYENFMESPCNFYNEVLWGFSVRV